MIYTAVHVKPLIHSHSVGKMHYTIILVLLYTDTPGGLCEKLLGLSQLIPQFPDLLPTAAGVQLGRHYHLSQHEYLLAKICIYIYIRKNKEFLFLHV